MSIASQWKSAAADWRQRAKQLRHTLQRRVGLDRWYPHIPLALAHAPLGLLPILAFADAELGVSWGSTPIAHLERQIPELAHQSVIELALGLSLLAVSVGIALRSRLAWMWSIGAMGLALAVRLPLQLGEMAFALYLAVMLAFMLGYRHRFDRHDVANTAMFALVTLATFFTWATLNALRLGEQFEPPVRDVVTALYLTIVTVSSVGYGDIVAQSADAKIFVMTMIGLGVLVLATTLSAILLPLLGGRLREILGGKPHMDRTNHYVIVGKSPLARNAATELEKRRERVTLVLDNASDDEFFKARDVVVGDPADLAVLRAAGTEHAKGVLALSTDDATNGFVVLGVNEIDATIQTVAALNEPTNQFRLRRTQPSLLLSLQALGGQLLAMALTGEHVNLDMLTKALEVHANGLQGADPPKPG